MKINYSPVGSKLVLFLLVLLLSLSMAHAQKNQESPERKKLFAEILHMDSVLFNAFNNRDIATMKTLFTSDLELYQDNDGRKDYAQTMAGFAALFTKDYMLTRTLVPQSMEVYPIKNFGAIQTASHVFSHMENGKPERGTFKFLHIWQKTPGGWKISRVVTYDH